MNEQTTRSQLDWLLPFTLQEDNFLWEFILLNGTLAKFNFCLSLDFLQILR